MNGARGEWGRLVAAAHCPTEAPDNVADATCRAAVRTTHARLRTYKHDLQALGLS